MSKLFDKELFESFCWWIAERERVRLSKEAGEPKPWTEDAIIRDHRFCNARRMDDKVSVWLMDHWYDNKQNTRTLLVAATLARMINWPEALSQITDGKRFTVDHWDAKRIIDVLSNYRDKGNKVFTGAYIINGGGGGSKIVQVVNNVKVVRDTASKIVYPESMQRTHTALMGYNGIGSFIAGQIVADLRHTKAMNPEDTMSWAPIGPGSRRGLRRLMGESASGTMAQKEFDELLPQLIERLQKMKRLDFVIGRLEAMDVQNCLCEFDKYTRLKNNEGQVRSKYQGVADSGNLEGV